jgi:hypothetical protein
MRVAHPASPWAFSRVSLINIPSVTIDGGGNQPTKKRPRSSTAPRKASPEQFAGARDMQKACAGLAGKPCYMDCRLKWKY